MGHVEYDSNNSGGSWWLTDQNWKDLEAAGWVVQWKSLEPLCDNKGNYKKDERGIPVLVPAGQGGSKYSIGSGDPDANGEYRWLGALATTAYKPGCDDLMEAVREWEEVTGESSTDAGCPCCGVPHNFTLYDDKGEYVDSGPSSDYSASW